MDGRDPSFWLGWTGIVIIEVKVVLLVEDVGELDATAKELDR